MAIVVFIILTIFGFWLKGKYVDAYRGLRSGRTEKRAYYKNCEQRVLDRSKLHSFTTTPQIDTKKKKKLSRRELKKLVQLEMANDKVAEWKEKKEQEKRTKKMEYDFMMKHPDFYKDFIRKEYPEDFKRLFPSDISNTF